MHKSAQDWDLSYAVLSADTIPLFGDRANGCTDRTGDVTLTAYAAGLVANTAAPIDLIIKSSNAWFIFILNITIK